MLVALGFDFGGRLQVGCEAWVYVFVVGFGARAGVLGSKWGVVGRW